MVRGCVVQVRLVQDAQDRLKKEIKLTARNAMAAKAKAAATAELRSQLEADRCSPSFPGSYSSLISDDEKPPMAWHVSMKALRVILFVMPVVTVIILCKSQRAYCHAGGQVSVLGWALGGGLVVLGSLCKRNLFMVYFLVGCSQNLECYKYVLFNDRTDRNHLTIVEALWPST